MSQKKNTGQKTERPKRRLLVWLILCLAGITLLAWMVDLPGRLVETLATRALSKHQPNQALSWCRSGEQVSRVPERLAPLKIRALLQLNMNGSAQQLLGHASRQNSDPIYTSLGLVARAQMGDTQAAQQLLQTSELPTPPEAYEAVVRCAIQTENFDLAVAVLDQMRERKITPEVVAYQHGRVREVKQDFESASSSYAAAAELAPKMTRAPFRAGMTLVELHDFALADAHFEACTGTAYEIIGEIERANCAYEMSKYDSADALIASCLTAAPLHLSQLYLQLDQYVDYDRAALVAARIADARERSNVAIELLERVLAYNHRNLEAHTLLLKNLRAFGDEERAEAVTSRIATMSANRRRCFDIRLELESAELTNERELQLRNELAHLYFATESLAEAQLEITEILSIAPNHTQARSLQKQIENEKLAQARFGL